MEDISSQRLERDIYQKSASTVESEEVEKWMKLGWNKIIRRKMFADHPEEDVGPGGWGGGGAPIEGKVGRGD